MQISSSTSTIQNQDHSTDYTKYLKDKDYGTLNLSMQTQRNNNFFRTDDSSYAAASTIDDNNDNDTSTTVNSNTKNYDHHTKNSYNSFFIFSCDDIKNIIFNDLPVVANVSSAILGVSIFAMPWGFLQSGVLGGSLITLFVSLLSFETARILLYAQRIYFHTTGHIKSYAEIAKEVLGGSQWGEMVKIATAISCLGGCVSYLIFLGEICGQLFDTSIYTSLMIASLPLTLLSWIR